MNTHVCDRLRSSLVLLSCSLLAAPVGAVEFALGDIDGQLDSALALGVGVSTANPAKLQLGAANGNDGRRNYRSGDVFSTIFKGTHDLELKRDNIGMFLRGTYWYDTAQRDHSQRFKDIDDNDRQASAKTAGFQLLDAFVYYFYDINGEPGSARVGKQVVNWGESIFIQGGLNVVNPFNQAALRRPGSEVKDALVPVNLLYMTQNINEAVSFDAFYQLDWEQTQLDNCGTFFSGNDFTPEGCTGLDVGGRLVNAAAANRGLGPFGVVMGEEGVRIPRSADQDARNSGQWGLSLRWYVTQLDAEFGAYAANYHSRSPYLGTVSSRYYSNTGFAPQLCSNLGVPSAGCGAFLASTSGQTLAGALRMGTSQYLSQYPEDIRLYGLTFSTTLRTGTAVQGELSYRPNMPVQLNGTDVLQSLLNANGRSPLSEPGLRPTTDSTLFNGYRRKEVTQAQVSAMHSFGQVMGANQLLLVGEAGATYVGGLEGKNGPRYGRSGAYGNGALVDNSICRAISSSPQYCTDEGFVTPFSWGYRMRATLSYSGVMPGLDLRPNLSWAHDVKGYSPGDGSAFNEGSRSVSLGLDATFMSKYSLSLSYTDYIDGTYGTRGDRDFASIAIGATF
ncbi:type V secretory pathway, adhesin AidA [Pseudomonas fluorescens]|uniref:Type V secretory pathway, adhesin AidA n=1 Tax=Pseudomonas fluorescens TaxID=294 RepID=A0A3S4P189_PSEFL|nr:type V secretory pathway, adhesin AidA [Pseudomonas fluorescens]